MHVHSASARLAPWRTAIASAVETGPIRHGIATIAHRDLSSSVADTPSPQKRRSAWHGTPLPRPKAPRTTARPTRMLGPLHDPERQKLWCRTVAEFGGDVARADVVLAARLRAMRPPEPDPLPEPISADWLVKHPGPDPALVAWLHRSHHEWIASLSPEQHDRIVGRIRVAITPSAVRALDEAARRERR